MRKIERIEPENSTPFWQFRYQDGRGKVRYKRFTTRKAGEAFRARIQQQKTAGIDPGQVVLFSALVSEWRESRRTRGLRASSIKDYEQLLAHLLREFANRDIRSIRAVDLERLRNALVDRIQQQRRKKFERVLDKIHDKPQADRSESDLDLLSRERAIREALPKAGIRTAGKIVGLARMLWKFAVSRDYAANNIATGVDKPKTDRSPSEAFTVANILSAHEINLMIAATPIKYQCAVRFLFDTGVRFGELCGLQWGDVDWSAGQVVIRRQLSGVSGELTPPKTAAGERTIDVEPELLQALRQHLKETTHDELAERRGARLEEQVFAIDPRNFRTRVWHPALRKAGLRRIRVHDSRHTWASHAIASGVPQEEVARTLGHADPGITWKTYYHQFKKFAHRESAARRVAEHRRAEAAAESAARALQQPAA